MGLGELFFGMGDPLNPDDDVSDDDYDDEDDHLF